MKFLKTQYFVKFLKFFDLILGIKSVFHYINVAKQRVYLILLRNKNLKSILGAGTAPKRTDFGTGTH